MRDLRSDNAMMAVFDEEQPVPRDDVRDRIAVHGQSAVDRVEQARNGQAILNQVQVVERYLFDRHLDHPSLGGQTGLRPGASGDDRQASSSLTGTVPAVRLLGAWVASSWMPMARRVIPYQEMTATKPEAIVYTCWSR